MNLFNGKLTSKLNVREENWGKSQNGNELFRSAHNT